jgi:hypothetical protein
MAGQAAIGAKLNLSGTLEWRDKDGNILSTTTISGSIPLADTGLTVEQAQELINSQGKPHGCDHRQ